MKVFIYICFFVTLASCSQSRESSPVAKTATAKELKEERLKLISSGLIHKLEQMNKDHINIVVDSVYRHLEFAPLWYNGDSLLPVAKEMVNIIHSSWGYGLPKNYRQALVADIYDTLQTEGLDNTSKANFLADLDLLLTFNGLQLANDLKYGFTSKDSFHIEDHIDSLNIKDVQCFLGGIASGNMDSVLMSDFAPQHELSKNLITGLKYYAAHSEMTDYHFNLPNYKQDSTKAYAIAREALVQHGFSDSTRVKIDSLFKLDLKVFQELHGLEGDLKIGNFTKDAIATSNLDRYIQAVATLEKWKQNQFEGDKYIFVNIPSYTLRYFDGDSTVNTHRVVVGAMTTRTPSFQAKLKYLTVNPRWHVPYSISSKEILPAAKKDSTYFARNGYKVYTMGRQQVDPTTVDWSRVSQNNFGYRVVQNSGRYNSLGVVAFMFPNKHAVFIHDTPSKYFFNRDVRAFSHGCVRLENPVDLAGVVLERDQNTYTQDSVNSIISTRNEHRISLKTHINVYLDYFTTEGKDGRLVFHRDIYGRDTRLEERLKTFIKEGQNLGRTL